MYHESAGIESNHELLKAILLTRELRTCARASCRYDVESGTRSLARSIPVNFFFDFRLLSAFDRFLRVINKRNGDLRC